MSQNNFEQWLKELDLSFWGTAQHKITPAQFFERQNSEDVVLLDVRSQEETESLALPFALRIPMQELPQRWHEIPNDRLVGTFCSSATRAEVAWVYLQLHGLGNVRIIDGRYNDLTSVLKPGKILQTQLLLNFH